MRLLGYMLQRLDLRLTLGGLIIGVAALVYVTEGMLAGWGSRSSHMVLAVQVPAAAFGWSLLQDYFVRNRTVRAHSPLTLTECWVLSAIGVALCIVGATIGIAAS